jgi:hypothetical protein
MGPERHDQLDPDRRVAPNRGQLPAARGQTPRTDPFGEPGAYDFVCAV